MDIGKAFMFVFEDKDWVVKLLIAAAILLVGVLLGVLIIPGILAAALLAGYGVEITRRVIHDDPQVLPEWTNWGELMVDGLKVIVIGLVYALPIIVVSACMGIPIGILSEDAQELSSLFSAALSCLSFLWAIVMSLVLPAAIGAYAAKGELNAAFRFGEILALVRNNFKTYLLVLVMAWVASIIGGLGTIVCFIGWFVTLPYSYMVTGHLYGQAYKQVTGQAAAPAVESF
jgi:Protein of unknown function (DUF4013)